MSDIPDEEIVMDEELVCNANRSKNWMVTVFGEDRRAHFDEVMDRHEEHDIQFAAWQLERTPTTHRLHYQAYVVFNSQKTKATVRRLFPRCDVRARRGKHGDCKRYVHKERTREPGAMPAQVGNDDDIPDGQGQRTDISAMLQTIRDGNTVEDVMDSHEGTWVRCHAAVDKFHAAKGKRVQREAKPVVTVLYGVSGGGKTHAALSRTDPQNRKLISAPSTGAVYFNHRPEDDLILEEFEGWISIPLMKAMMDTTTCSLKVYYGEKAWIGKTLLITSNYHPLEWWKDMKYPDQQAIMRKIDNLVKFTAEYDGELHYTVEKGTF